MPSILYVPLGYFLKLTRGKTTIHCKQLLFSPLNKVGEALSSHTPPIQQTSTNIIQDTVFETYTIQSATPNNTINLEVPLQPLLRALKSASAPTTTTASIRLTKKEGAPWLVVTITTTSFASNTTTSMPPAEHPHASHDPQDTDPNIPDNIHIPNPALPSHTTERKERETHIALDIPVVVLAAAQVAGLHEPRCREPDCHIYLPPLGQLKSISDRFARLAAGSASSGNAAPGAGRFMSTAPSASSSAKSPKLELAATMHGTLRLSYTSDALSIASEWHGLENPELDAAQVGGEEGLANHPSTRMKMVRPAESDEGEGWAKVRVDSRDWGRVLGVGRVGGRVIGCESFSLLLHDVHAGCEADDVMNRLLQQPRPNPLLLHVHPLRRPFRLRRTRTRWTKRRWRRRRRRGERAHLLHLLCTTLRVHRNKPIRSFGLVETGYPQI